MIATLAPTLAHTAVVLEGHTLGVIIGNQIQILRASVLRGSPYPAMGTVHLGGEYRTASRADFDAFNVTWHPDYLVSDVASA